MVNCPGKNQEFATRSSCWSVKPPREVEYSALFVRTQAINLLDDIVFYCASHDGFNLGDDRIEIK